MTREEWLRQRTFVGSDIDTAAVVDRKIAGEVTVAVVLPALNVADTVGPICTSIREHWMGSTPLVDDLIVVDSESGDDTAAVATACGARVVTDREVLPSMGSGHGKGEAMWKSLAATTADLILWIDADILDFDPQFVPHLLAPLIDDPQIGYVKAFYRRPLGDVADGGGRVTEICARPLINRFFPDLAGFVQPLAGEAAGRRELLTQVPFFSGYAVEIGLLIDLLDTVGLDAMAQVDLGTRAHTHQTTAALGQMAYAITDAVLTRANAARETPLRPYHRPVPGDGEWRLERTPVSVATRPPMARVLAGDRTG